ncbi:hypothetical protein ACP275_12G041600 [Erythranthe tilingii]
MKHFVLPTFLLLLLLGNIEVKAETCKEELPPKGLDLCDKAKCVDECRKRHGSLAFGRCYSIDSCLCQYSCPN